MTFFFQDICAFIDCPLSPEKTVGPAQQIEFLGLGLDSVTMTIFISKDKLDKATAKIWEQLAHHNTTVHHIQSLAGLLNFLTRAIKLTRTFSH